MCFSPEASFTAAAVTGTLGVLAVSRASRLRDLPLAAMPLLFAVHQTLEGFIWLDARQAAGAAVSGALVLAYLVFAKTLWPVFAPIAVMLVEPRRGRVRLMAPWLAAGLAVSAYLLWGLGTRPYSVEALDGHLVYRSRFGPIAPELMAYLAATTFPLLLSSLRTLRWLGLVIAVGFAVAYFFYWAAFLSVWCFFAAVASALILFHFERAGRASEGAAVNAS